MCQCLFVGLGGSSRFTLGEEGFSLPGYYAGLQRFSYLEEKMKSPLAINDLFLKDSSLIYMRQYRHFFRTPLEHSGGFLLVPSRAVGRQFL